MTRDARQFWERVPSEAKAANRAAEDFEHIRQRRSEIAEAEGRAGDFLAEKLAQS